MTPLVASRFPSGLNEAEPKQHLRVASNSEVTGKIKSKKLKGTFYVTKSTFGQALELRAFGMP
jgi:hypothetical protein